MSHDEGIRDDRSRVDEIFLGLEVNQHEKGIFIS
jgi:hypothetical protein